MRRSGNTDKRIIPIIFFLLILLIWQLLTGTGLIQAFILPSPLKILSTLIEKLPTLLPHLLVTLGEAMSGLGFSIILALGLAVLMDNVSIVKKAVYPLLVVSQTIPLIALAPLFVLWFGFGILPKIIVVILVCFFPMVVNLLDGLESADRDIVNLLRSMGASRFQVFMKAKLPPSLLYFFSGLRVSVTYSIMGAVIGEWLGGTEGLGVFMIRAKHAFQLDMVFAVIVLIVVMSLVLFRLVGALQSIFVPYTRSVSK
jgi:ABC-type nitrate/sulfonate/bicarbonate transport system permease component